MDVSESKKISDVGASTGTHSEFDQIDGKDDDDPISAYFKQRCKGSSVYFKQKCKGISEIYSEDLNSSIGLIDVDCVSLFDEEENEEKNFRFSVESFDQVNKNSVKIGHKKEADDEVESELEKQRALAQKALKRLSTKTNDLFSFTSDKRESTALSDISSKLLNVKLPNEGNLEKEWLQPNFSPKTPRYFNDELSSFGGENENLPVEVGTSAVSKTRQSLYTKKINSMLKELTLVSVDSDMKFESQTKEEQINRFEEDERKFKLESASLLHNSQISQFSGIAGDLAQWQPETSRPEAENKKLSIGEFFNMRSDRISSLVGSGDGKKKKINFEMNLEQEIEAPKLSNAKAQQICKSEFSLSVCETPESHKPKSKVRRCVSTNDLKPAPELPKNVKNSRDSTSRNSTLLVQEILAEMQPGLSGSEIYENIMKAYKKRKEFKECSPLEKGEKFKKPSETGETPKSSKTQKRKETSRKKKEPTLPEACKDSKSLPDRKSTLGSEKEKKEEKPICGVKLNANTPSARNVKKKELGASKGFYSSTPKNQDVKSQNHNYRKNCGKAAVTDEDWEPPRVNLIKTIDLSKSEYGEENEKTVLISSSGFSEVNKKETFTIEDTILAGDLTVISQRIEEMKRDSVCIVRTAESEEPVLLTVVQKLASLPKGSLDCSALTPLLRDEFPELLSNFPAGSGEPSASNHPKTNVKGQDALVDLPGSWVKLPGVWGLNEKIYACADVEKIIHVPFINISQKWLLVSIKSLELVHPHGKKLSGERKDLEWFIKDFVVISLKETIIPPDNKQSLKVSFKSEVATKLELTITFEIKELIDGEAQTRNLRLLVNNVHPENYINVLPSDAINFGVIADQCFDQTVVQVTFDGICELPLMVYIEEDEPRTGHFSLKPCIDHPHERGWDDSIYHHKFFEGEKQVLDFRVDFRPNVLLRADSEIQDFKAFLVLMIGSKTDSDGILKKIPIKGSVGFARFLCRSPRGPLIFKASEKGQSVTRLYPLKNVGSLSIEFSVLITNEDHKIMEGEDMFVVPKSFCLPRNEEAGISVTFNAYGNQNLYKRYLILQVKPNGRNIYETELIGIVNNSECKPLSPTSGVSVSTKSTANSESVPVKLLTTTQSLSWAAVALEKESRLNFQIKSLSSATTSVRISFERNLDAFKLLNENGEKVQKLRKVLKPDSPCGLTVIFRPDVVGAHNTSLIFETAHSSRKKRVLLNGIGGVPNLVMKNAKSDLTGCKILSLQHSRVSNQFENVLEFANEGRIPAFVILKRLVNDFSLSHDLEIVPSSFVIHPDSSVAVKISQKLRSEDLQQLLSDREIYKIATLRVLSGDEPSRLRIRKLVENGKLQRSERLKVFTAAFRYEKGIHLRNFKDSPGFESEFFKSLRVSEVAVVVEKNTEIFEPSILEETTDEFFSFISDRTVIPRIKCERQARAESCKGAQTSTSSNTVETDTSPFSEESLKATCSHNLVTKWLETLDCV